MDGFAVRELGERFDVVLCFGILHRVTDPIAFLRTFADVLEPGGEIVLETYGSTLDRRDARRSSCTSPAISTRATTSSYWGFPAEGLRRLGRTIGLDDVEILEEVVVDGHPRIVAVLRAAD